MKKSLLLLIAVGLLSGCESLPYRVQKDDAEFAPPSDLSQPAATVRGGGLYQTSYNWSLIQDRRAYRVGDILTVLLDESTQSSKQAKTNFGKKNDVELGVPLVAGKTLDKLSGSVSGNRNFNGNATSAQQNMLRGSITVAVHQVLSNGVMIVRGEKWLTLNQETSICASRVWYVQMISPVITPFHHSGSPMRASLMPAVVP